MAFSFSHTSQSAEEAVYVLPCWTREELLGASGHSEIIHTPGESADACMDVCTDVSFM